MILLYLKQAWNLVRQERLFSTIYILGTGLSISMVMVLSIVFYIKLADVYPETNRGRMLVADQAFVKYDEGHSSSNPSMQVINTCFAPLKEVEAIGLELNDVNEYFVQPGNGLPQQQVKAKFVNTGFWKVFPFRFTEGQPFSEADQQSGLSTVVLAQSLARKLFGDEEAVGRYVSLNFRPYRVCGVVKDASFATERSFAQLWVPYTANPASHEEAWDETNSLGACIAYLLVAEDADLAAVKRQAEENVQRYSTTLAEGFSFTMQGQPDFYWQSVLRGGGMQEVDFGKRIAVYLFIFFLLLFVPAVSLSGMTDSRMERRLAEIGVRRAFGAPTGSLLRQILAENFLFTLLGGALGMIFSYLLLYLTRDWVMQIGASFIDVAPEGTDVIFTPSMLMNYEVFGIALLLCFLLNLLSALIPAWRASRRQIIYSLNAK